MQSSAVYQSVGNLMPAATSTRPDIAYVAAALSSYNSKPYSTHMTAAKRVLRYLKATAGIGLVFPPTSASSSLDILHGYTDSDFCW